MKKIRNYTYFSKLKTFKERFEYLKLDGAVSAETFGFDRYLNQRFYKTREWRNARDQVIVRDNGCDLGIEGREIYGKIYIHHMNTVAIEDLVEGSDLILNPEFLVCTTLITHNAIHYGNYDLIVSDPIVRTPNDTAPWLK